MVASVSQLNELKSTHDQLRQQVNKMIQLAHSHDADAKVFPQFVRQLVEILGSRAGFLWRFNAQGDLTYVSQYYSTRRDVAFINSCRPSKEMLLGQARTKVGGVVEGRLTDGAHQRRNTDPSFPVWVVPIERQGMPWGVIEIVPTENASQENLRHGLQIIRHLARVMGHRLTLQASRVPLKTSKETEEVSAPAVEPPKQRVKKSDTCQSSTKRDVRGPTTQHLEKVAFSFHETLGLEQTAMVVVNEFRRLLRCDRVSVVTGQGTKWKVLAISGQEVINHRADVVCQLMKIAESVKETTDLRWFKPSSNKASCSVAHEIHALYGALTWSEVGVVSLKQSSTSLESDTGVTLLIVEYQSCERSDESDKTIEKLIPHARAAVSNAIEHNQIFLLSLWKTLGHYKQVLLSSSRTKMLTWTGCFVLAAAFLCFYPVDFEIQGQGQLLPVKQRDVFADVQGVVTTIHVAHGDTVQEGDVLLEMRNTDLDIAIAEILGKRRSAEEQLTSIQRLRHTESIAQDEETRLAGQVFQLQELLKGLQEQLVLLQEKKERLLVRSPMNGQVTTWNVHRKLMLRPVLPGQVLVTIADQTGPWNLEVYLPESEVGHLLSNHQGQVSQEQEVEFLVASQPTISHAGMLKQMDNHAQLYEEFGHAVRASIELDKEEVPSAPAGTTVTAHINCGQRSIGFVWFHRLAEFVHTRILFPLF